MYRTMSHLSPKIPKHHWFHLWELLTSDAWGTQRLRWTLPPHTGSVDPLQIPGQSLASFPGQKQFSIGILCGSWFELGRLGWFGGWHIRVLLSGMAIWYTGIHTCKYCMHIDTCSLYVLMPIQTYHCIITYIWIHVGIDVYIIYFHIYNSCLYSGIWYVCTSMLIEMSHKYN